MDDVLVTDGQEADQPVLIDLPTWDQVRSTFGGGTTTPVPAPPQDQRAVPGAAEPAAEPVSDQHTFGVTTSRGRPSMGSAEPAVLEPVSAPPAFDILLGDSQPTRQFGLLGAVAAEEWRRVALDLNGCNTISVFGVQGGGKSYTLGSILEMAARPIQGINLLHNPLASVVFHYHQTQDYPPEFVSMVHPNDDPTQLERLTAYGATPAAVPDVLVLSTTDTLERRRSEFPGIAVEPIGFASQELTVADWRFLMGATAVTRST